MPDLEPQISPTTAFNPQPGLTIPAPQKNGQRLSVNTFTPVTQAGSYEFDRIIKAGEVLKRTRKTKVRTASERDTRALG